MPFAGWPPQCEYASLHQTAGLMISINCGSEEEQQSDAASASGTTYNTQTPALPVSSSKEWASISTVATRLVAVLGWLQGRIANAAERAAGGAAATLTPVEQVRDDSQQIVMWSLMHLLDILLAGKLPVLQAPLFPIADNTTR